MRSPQPVTVGSGQDGECLLGLLDEIAIHSLDLPGVHRGRLPTLLSRGRPRAFDLQNPGDVSPVGSLCRDQVDAWSLSGARVVQLGGPKPAAVRAVAAVAAGYEHPAIE